MFAKGKGKATRNSSPKDAKQRNSFPQNKKSPFARRTLDILHFKDYATRAIDGTSNHHDIIHPLQRVYIKKVLVPHLGN